MNCKSSWRFSFRHSVNLQNPLLQPSKEFFGIASEVGSFRGFDSIKVFKNFTLLWQYDIEQIALLSPISAAFLISNGLDDKRRRLVQSHQNRFTLIVKHVVYTSMIEIAETRFDRSIDCLFINQDQQCIQASFHWTRIVVELKQIRRLPLRDLLSSRQKSAQ